MPAQPRITTVLPCTDLVSATQFFVRLGFTVPTDEEKARHDDYLILWHPSGSDLHLRQISSDEQGWLDPLRNPFGIYVYVQPEEIDTLAKEFADEIIEPAKKAETKDHGMYEFSLNGPDGCLVRVGWYVRG